MGSEGQLPPFKRIRAAPSLGPTYVDSLVPRDDEVARRSIHGCTPKSAPDFVHHRRGAPAPAPRYLVREDAVGCRDKEVRLWVFVRWFCEAQPSDRFGEGFMDRLWLRDRSEGCGRREGLIEVAVEEDSAIAETDCKVGERRGQGNCRYLAISLNERGYGVRGRD